MPKKAIIIGAGPAGLTAAYELLKRTDIRPIVLEKCKQVGGISKTIDYKGNKMDFGPHRFFSKSDRVMNWWTNIMPLHTPKGEDLTISYQNKSRTIDTGDFLTTEETDGKPPAKSMLVIQRLTRIYFLRQFFAYPIQLSIATLGQLGILTTIKIVFSYLYARLFPRKPQKSLEDFMINKFGSVLYHIFFKDYTEKVWGMDCNKISADWGAQRIKGVSLSKAVIHAAKALTKKKKGDIGQKGTETSLIEQFLYPAMGAGAMWEEVARQVEVLGGRIVSNYEVTNIHIADNKVYAISAYNSITGKHELLEGDYFISTMPIQELIAGLHGEEVPTEVKEVAAGLIYRDFVYAGVLVKKMTMDTPKDSWIYIQEKDVKVARMQVYNNWGPYMVADPNTVWLGLEYFCTKGDAIWNMSDEEIKKLAAEELVKMELILAEDVLDSTVNRMEKTYPAYFGTYEQFDVIRHYLDGFVNLFLVGRNGMHKYNNTDHSMLTAMVAIDNIDQGILTKHNLWEINTEQEYHEEKKGQIPQETFQPKTTVKFKQFVQSYENNKKLLWSGIVLTVLQFISFKLLYPFADFSNDSFTYIAFANNNENSSLRPIGYSKFLRAFSAIATSEWLLVAFQYFAMQAALLYLFFTIKYWLSISKIATKILFILLLVNPITLYIGNYISSDACFAALSITWFTHLWWIIQRPNKFDWLISALLLFCILGLRYNALYYPFVTTFAFLISKNQLWRKALAISFTFLTLTTFISIVTNENYKKSGTKTFTSFGGWQMAANALYAYPTIHLKEAELPSEETRKVNRFIKHYFDTLRNKKLPPLISTAFLWGDSMPLKRYWFHYIKVNKIKDSSKAWMQLEPIYTEYAKHIISHHPLEFAKYYLYPNLKEYIRPDLEVFNIYNLGQNKPHQLATMWFRYDTTAIMESSLKKYQKNILTPFSWLFTGLNAFFTFGFIIFLLKWKTIDASIFAIRKTVSLIATFLGLNLCFSILAAPVVFRYQFVPMIIAIVGSILLTDTLIKQETLKSK